MNAGVPAVTIQRKSALRRLDIPFLIMGLFFISIAITEYLFPQGDGSERLAIKVLCGSQIVFAFAVAFFTRGVVFVPRWINISFFTLCAWLCLSGIVRSTNISQTLYLWVMYLYWYASFLFFFLRTRRSYQGLQMFLSLAVFSLLLWIPALANSTSSIIHKHYPHGSALRQNYIGYYIVALFPYILMVKKKYLKVVGITLISFGTLYSLKRGAVLALGLMGVCTSFLYVISVVPPLKKTRAIIALIFLWGLVFMIGGIFVYTNMEAIERRMSESSHREGVFRLSFDAISKAEFYELIIGQGDRKAKTFIGAHTHNDWLFLLYDYGVIGVFLMLNIYVCLMHMLWKLCKSKSSLILPLASVLILMACVQLYSIGLYLKTFGIITGSIGIVAGSLYNEG